MNIQQREMWVRLAIRSAQMVRDECQFEQMRQWDMWANNWLSGHNRTKENAIFAIQIADNCRVITLGQPTESLESAVFASEAARQHCSSNGWATEWVLIYVFRAINMATTSLVQFSLADLIDEVFTKNEEIL